MATTYNAKGKVFLTKSQFDARKAAGTLQTGIEYMITDSDDTPYDDSLKGIIDGSITEFVIPEGVTTIRSYVFAYCISLTSITIPDSVTSIENSTFEGCRSLTSITISDSLTRIGNSSFRYCSSLTSVTIGSGVTKIGDSALNCGSSTNKATFTFTRTTPPTIQSNTFNASYISKIIVPAGCGSAYKAATNWSSFASYIEEAAE